MRYSVVVPTYNHCDDLLKPCIDSIIKYTDLSEIELIIVDNGSTDNTKDYLHYVETVFPKNNLHWLKFDKPLGYAGAINAGISYASCETIILLNNDTVLLEQPKNQWLEILSTPLEQDPKAGISCIIKSKFGKHEFAVFFCVAIKADLFRSIGVLDESYGVGGGEDIDFCIDAQNHGWKVVEVFEKHLADGQFTGGFPIWHKGGKTVSEVSNWNQIFGNNMLKVAKKYDIEHYRYLLSNDYERAVFLKGDPVFMREEARYLWAANHAGKNLLEIGCSTGYGSQYFQDRKYVGLDYDQTIINVAREQEWGGHTTFICGDAWDFPIGHYDIIVAFEVVEHLHNGLLLVDLLKKHCKTLLVSVPYKEPVGFWGKHHVLHNLDESHFPGASFNYLDWEGRITGTPKEITKLNPANLMLVRYE